MAARNETQNLSASFIESAKDLIGSEYNDVSLLGWNILNLLNSVPQENEKIEVIEFIITNLGEVPSTGKVLGGESLTDETWEISVAKNSDYISGVFNRLVYDRPSP